jgi:hypothetical protein
VNTRMLKSLFSCMAMDNKSLGGRDTTLPHRP